jgi:hypothetical protein
MADKIIDYFYRLKIDFFSLYVAQERSVNCSTVSTICHFFCQLLESGWARINWIRAVDTFCVEQLISCQKCRPIDCWAIKFRAVDTHSVLFNGEYADTCKIRISCGITLNIKFSTLVQIKLFCSICFQGSKVTGVFDGCKDKESSFITNPTVTIFIFILK